MIEERVFYENIGNKISNFRENRGITQDRLGKYVDLSRVSIVNIEKGRQKPSMYLLYKFAELFNVPLIAFFESYNVYNDYGVKSGQESITDKDYNDITLFMNSEIDKP